MNDQSPYDAPTLAAWLREDADEPFVGQAQEPDWLRVAQEATRTGLAGLLLERCRRVGLPVPPGASAALHRTATAVAASNLHLRQELGRLLKALNDADVPAMLLKGAALNLTVYHRLDLRPMSDLDLLIHPEHAHDALAVLTRIGCRQERPLVRRDFFPRCYYETELIAHGARPARIDLHVRPLRPLRMAQTMPREALWTDAQVVYVEGATAWVPRSDIMFVHLAAHAAFHGCSRLIWLYDLERLVRSAGAALDWDKVADQCRSWRLSLAVRTAVAAATARLGPFAPDHFVRQLAAHRVSWRDRLTLAQAPRDAPNPVSHVLVDLLCTPGLRLRAAYAWALLRPDDGHLKELYPHRHRGWRVLAHAWRLVRAVMRATHGFGCLVRRAFVPNGRAMARRLRFRAPHTCEAP